ncbi:hypothetical protein [uncultured Microbacterium sp.]|uniref:hypothetical protein n=1 Tax=uncultured Microbacterium sp. TaxID=191216 RepID=UPI0026211BE3|nr:hypothetical protein [uncultured Microbacterium sp.]HYP73136.1 hypothetical protein [Microbacterium sp.]
MSDTTTPDDLDAILAANTATAASAPRIPSPGDTLHCLRSGLTVNLGGGSMITGRAVVLERGQTFTVTSEMIEAARDRNGSLATSWVGVVYDEERQVKRYGAVMVRPGPAPSDLRPWEYGTPEWMRARDTARRRAYALPSEAERAEALAEVERIYGPAGSTSKTTAVYRPGEHPTERAAAAQAERRRQGIADGTR